MTDMQPTPYDYRTYDRIWQRVDPTLTPYPNLPATPEASAAMTPRTDSLPGAQQDPCCMGSAAMEMLQVLDGFIQVELEGRWYYTHLLRTAPATSRGMLREFITQKSLHAKRLMAVYYLITGQCYDNNLICAPAKPDAWCQTLRQRYHTEACGGLNYARAADGTTDPCLSSLLKDLSTATYHMAQRLLVTLEKSI